jgi:hypothetical protein
MIQAKTTGVDLKFKEASSEQLNGIDLTKKY